MSPNLVTLVENNIFLLTKSRFLFKNKGARSYNRFSWRAHLVVANVLTKSNNEMSRAGALVQWLQVMTQCQKVVGSNPVTVYWMDNLTILTLICCTNCIVCYKRRKINKKDRGRGCPILKKNELGMGCSTVNSAVDSNSLGPGSNPIFGNFY